MRWQDVREAEIEDASELLARRTRESTCEIPGSWMAGGAATCRLKGRCLAGGSVRQEPPLRMDARLSAYLRLSLHAALAMLAAAPVALGGCKKKPADASAGTLLADGGGEIVAIHVPDAG